MSSVARVTYVFAWPAALLLGVYLCIFLGLNSIGGAALLSRVLTQALHGGLEFHALTVAPNLLSVTMHQARLTDLAGRPAIEVGRLACTVAPGGLVRNRIELADCEGEEGRVLAFEYDDGSMGLVQAFEGRFRPKAGRAAPPTIVFTNFNLIDVDVLIALRDMMLRFDGVNLTNGEVEIGRTALEVRADARATGARLLMNDRLMGLGDGKASWDMVAWDVLRRNSPWRAAWGVPPTPADGARGWIDIDFDAVVIDRLRWRGDDIEMERFLLDGTDVAFDGGGVLRLMPERPKLAPAERALVAYDGWGVLSMRPTSTPLQWMLPGVFSELADAPAGAGMRPLRFEGHGSVRFFEGETRVVARDVGVLGWRLDALDAGVAWRSGIMSLSRDATASIWGGQVTGGGWFESETGRWALDLCVEGLRLGDAAAPYVTDPGTLELFGALLSTTPAVCPTGQGWYLPPWLEHAAASASAAVAATGSDDEAESTAAAAPAAAAAAAGVRLHGDLTTKAMEVAPAATTPAGKDIQPPMIEVAATDVLLRWPRPVAGLPMQTARASVHGHLTQRGVVVAEHDGRPGLVVRVGDDELTFRGAIDTVLGELTPSELVVRSNDFGPWVEALGGPRLGPSRIQARASISGPLGAPLVSGIEARLDHEGVDGGPPDFEATLRGDVRGDALSVGELKVASSLGNVEARGAIDLFDGSPLRVRDDPRLRLDVSLVDVDVGRLAPTAGIDATFSSQLEVGGTLGAPTATGSNLELIDFRVAGEPIDYLLVEAWTATPRSVDARGILAIKGKGTLWGDAAVDLDAQTFGVEVHGRRFRLSEVRSLSAAGGRMGGDVDFDARGSGDLRRPSVAGRLSVRDLRAAGSTFGGVAATFYSFDDAVEIAALVATDLGVRGRLPYDGSPWTFDVAFRDTPVEAHFPALRQAISRSALTGLATLSADVLGDGRITGQVVLTDARVDVGERTFTTAPGAVALWRYGGDGGPSHRIDVAKLRVSTLGRTLEAGGRLELGGEGGDTVDAYVRGETDFALLRFVPDLIVDADGIAALDMTVRGPLEAPAFDGSLAFERARIAPRGLGTSVFFGPGRVAIGDGRMRVTDDAPLSGTLFGGDFTAWGDVGLRGLTPVSVGFNMFVTNLAYRVPNVANVTITSENLRFLAPDLATPSTWWLTGDITLVDGRYFDTIDVVSSSVSFGGFGRTVESFSLPVWMTVPTLGAINADLAIRGRDRFRVENTIATAALDMEFRTDLRLTGTFGAMVLLGELEALPLGTVTYRGRTFETQSVRLSFRGARDPYGYPMPYLDAEMTAAIRPCVRRTVDSSLSVADEATALSLAPEVFITAQVRGQLPYDLAFNLESTPFYDQRDQLSLILTGCTVDALTASEAGGRTLELVFAPVIDVLERSVEDRLAIDQVNLVPSAQGSAGISIQDEVSERLRWGIEAEVGAGAVGNRQLARVEYRLFDWLLIEAEEQGTSAQALTIDGGLRFRVRLD